MMRNPLNFLAIILSLAATPVYARVCKELATHSDDQAVMAECFEKLSLKKRFSKKIETFETMTMSGESVWSSCYKGWFPNSNLRHDELIKLCESKTFWEMGSSTSYSTTKFPSYSCTARVRRHHSSEIDIQVEDVKKVCADYKERMGSSATITRVQCVDSHGKLVLELDRCPRR